MLAMDYASFGLTGRPFRPTPDTELFFPAPSHEAALLAVQRAHTEGAGVAIIEGEPGTGKTLLGLKFLESLADDVPRAIFHCPRGVRTADVLQAILFDIGRNYQSLGEQELRLAVQDELLQTLGRGRSFVLLIDEGHNLTAEVIEELRILGNLESRESKALFTLILAQPSLRETLGLRENAGFAQRIGMRARLKPLTAGEAAEYIRFQLKQCGGRSEWLVNPEAMALLGQHTGGVPRLLNRAASLAFSLAASAELKAVDAEPVLDALMQLEMLPPEPEEFPEGPKPKLAPVDLDHDHPDVLPHPANAPRATKGLSGKQRKPQAKRKLA
jgi:type II secretory pathway predicted ATPase ExeA